MGFSDIHFTHGQVEFGKDFIAKLSKTGTRTQYSFQLKASDIGHSSWRNEVYGQVLEAYHSKLVHPSFDLSLPHQMVLVTTGRLVGNAPLAIKDLNTSVAADGGLPLEIWDRENLIEYMTKYGTEGIHASSSSGIRNIGQFYAHLGNAMDGLLTQGEIEAYSRCWVHANVEAERRLIWAAVESELVSNQCRTQGHIYLAIQARLAFLRLVLLQMWRHLEHPLLPELVQLYDRAIQSIDSLCTNFVSSFERDWLAADKDLLRLIEGPGTMVNYLVQSSRIMEVLGTTYFLATEPGSRDRIASLLEDFISREPGTAHPLSDNYAVSLVPTVLSLVSAGRGDTALLLLRATLVWLCDRSQQGDGLSLIASTPSDEITLLLGAPFEFFPSQRKAGSFLASTLADLAAFIGNADLYRDLINDLEACNIFPQYWQARDSEGQFLIEGEDVITYPNVTFSYDFTDFEAYSHSEAIVHEPREFSLQRLISPTYSLLLAVFLRDRYFPAVWPRLVASGR
jgi:hypothetical protein